MALPLDEAAKVLHAPPNGAVAATA